MTRKELLKLLDLDFSQYEYYGGLVVIRHKKGSDGNSESFILGEWGEMEVNIPKEMEKMFGNAMDVSVYSEGDEERILDLAMEDYENDEK